MTNDPKVTLTGNQVWCIRKALKEGQAVFGARYAVSQAAVYRLELKGDEPQSGPDIMHIARIAHELGITVPSSQEASAIRVGEGEVEELRASV